MIKLFIIIKFFFSNNKGRNYIFSYPRKNKIVVFDAKNIKIIDKILLTNLDYTIITKREGDFYINFRIIIKTIINNFSFKCGFEIAYYLTLLKIIRPKLIITYFNRNNIGLLSKYYNAEYISIQNGFHTLEHSLAWTPNLYCFGEYDKFLYERSGIKINNYFPIGSIKASYYINQLSKNNEIKYDICLVSQYRREIEEIGGCKGILEYTLLLKYIQKYLKYNPINFVIAMNNHDPQKERLYYEKLFSDKATLIDNKMEQFTTYFIMEQSEINISMNSTASFEALGWGKKSFIFNLTGDLDFSLNKRFNKYLFMHNNLYSEFQNKIDFLLNINDQEYKDLIRNDKKYFMNYNPKFPAHELIRGRIINFINK